MSWKSWLVIGVLALLTAIAHGGIYTVVPTAEGVVIYRVNRFTGAIIGCGSFHCGEARWSP